MRVQAIAIAAVLAILAGAVAGSGCARIAPGAASQASAGTAASQREPVHVGVIVNYLDDPFFVAIYEGVQAGAARLGVRTTVRSVTSNAEFADQATQLR